MKNRPCSGFTPNRPKYEAETRQRWGDTEAFAESRRRTKAYGEEDWKRLKGEADEILERIAALVVAGASPSSTEGMDLAEEHRLHIDRWFYPCSHRMHAALGEMYTADPRFRATFEQRAEGLADYLAAAIRANASTR